MKIVDGVCRQAAVNKQQIFDMDIEEIRDDHVLADPVRLQAGSDQSDFKWSEVYA